MSTASAQTCQQTCGRFAFFWRGLGFFPGFPWVWFFALLWRCRRFSWLSFCGALGVLLTRLEPTCHLDDIVQCLWRLITTADTCTAPELVFHTCTYFSMLKLWSEWELAGRNFSAFVKEGDPVLISSFGGGFCLFSLFLFGVFCCLFCLFSWLFFGFPCFGGFLGLVFGGFETRLDLSCHLMT